MSIVNKTLIILSPGFPKDESDSACLPFLQTFTRSLKEVDPLLNIIILAFDYPFSAREYLWEGIRVVPFNGNGKKRFNKLLLWFKIWKKINKLVAENNVIGFFSLWLGECALMGKYASRKHRIRSLTWILGQDAKQDNRYIKRIDPRPEDLVAMSDFLKDNIQHHFNVRPAYVIPLGIDKRLFTDLPVERDIDILGAGSLIPLKQYDVFIKMIGQLIKTRPGIKAIILGDGPELGRLQKMIAENNLTDNIKLAGKTDHPEVLALMQRSRIFLHPSSYEGFGTVCAEALYAGAKLVSFCKPMKKEFSNWFIVDSEAAMLQRLGNILDDLNPVYERVITYDSLDIARQVLTIYKEKVS